MLYFVKRNHKLKEYKDHFKDLENLCILLDKLNPELDKAKLLLDKAPSDHSKISLGAYLQQNHSFKYEEFKKLDLTVIGTFKILKQHLTDCKILLDNLKNYESFQGRIKFEQFATLFNFEDYIYEDKQFQYSIVSNYNKRLIPEFVSASFANLVYENLISEEIRRNMEQYFIAIMSNMDYHNFAHISQLKNELSPILKADKNVFYVLGATPQTFDDNEFVEIINDRIDKANDLIASGISTNNKPTEIWLKSNIDSQSIKTSSNFKRSSGAKTLANEKDNKRPTSKLTAENLGLIYEDIERRQLSNYNLFLITSTFHVLKTAIEVEKHFYNDDKNKPDNIVFVGNEKFFDLAHNKSNCNNNTKATFHKKKLKSFLYELFLHTLDRNAVNL